MSDKVQIVLPALCELDQSLIVHGARFKAEDPWQALLVTANLALFQAASAGQRVWSMVRRTEDGLADAADLSRVLAELGCLGCLLPKTREALTEEILLFGLSQVAKRVQTEPYPNHDEPR